MFIRNILYAGRHHMLAAMLFVWTLTWSPIAAVADPGIIISQGNGSFSFVDEQGDPSKLITVYTYLPERLKPSAAPIVFVMHGHGKNAKGYRDVWAEHADKYQFMVVVPLFDKEQWGGGEYSYASVIAKDGKSQAKSMWSFTVIEHLFDFIKRSTGNKNPSYFIYGHSEGGQFVHRLVLFLPDARFARAVAANSGWYTMPTFDVKFPYGLDGSPATEESLKKSLGREFILMLGERDTDPSHKDLRKTPGAMAQGVNRFERGQNYITEARNRATELKCKFGWSIRVVPESAHQNSEMSGPAAAALMGGLILQGLLSQPL